MSHEVADFMRLGEEAVRAGTVYAELVMPWTLEFAELDGKTMELCPPCVGCGTRATDGPYAFCNIYAVENATLHMPLVICSSCALQPTGWLQKKVRQQLRGLMPDVKIEFVMDAGVH
jgi:hypothetical protein